MIMARYHRPYRPLPNPKPSPVAQRGFAAVFQAIAAEPIDMSLSDMLAERERFRVEDEAKLHKQGELLLRGAN